MWETEDSFFYLILFFPQKKSTTKGWVYIYVHLARFDYLGGGGGGDGHGAQVTQPRGEVPGDGGRCFAEEEGTKRPWWHHHM
jgi:hypothetical protein